MSYVESDILVVLCVKPGTSIEAEILGLERRFRHVGFWVARRIVLVRETFELSLSFDINVPTIAAAATRMARPIASYCEIGIA